MEYIQPDGKRRNYIFPEGKQLTHEDIQQLAVYSYLLVIGKEKTINMARNKRLKLPKEFRQELIRQSKRYATWLKKNS